MALVIQKGDELRLRVTRSSKARDELLRFRITMERGIYEVGLLSGVREIEGRVIGAFRTELDLWASIADVAASPRSSLVLARGPFDLATVLVVLGSAAKVRDSARYTTEPELWAGIADHAASRQADLAMEAMTQEERNDRSSRYYR